MEEKDLVNCAEALVIFEVGQTEEELDTNQLRFDISTTTNDGWRISCLQTPQTIRIYTIPGHIQYKPQIQPLG